MCKATGTNGGHSNWVVLKKKSEIKAAQALGFRVGTHLEMGNVVPCDSYFQAKQRARLIRAEAPSS